MPEKYGKPAIEMARKLYCEHGGGSFDAIQAKMRKQYPSWNKSTLHDRKGRKGEVRAGWITLYNFERSLEIYTKTLVESVRSDEQDLYNGIKTVRTELQAKVATGEATKDELYQYRDFCKLEIEARKNLDLSRDNLETFVAGYEKLVIWLGQLDPAAGKALIKYGDKLAELAEAHYGKAETGYDGAVDREDESGNKPFSLLT